MRRRLGAARSSVGAGAATAALAAAWGLAALATLAALLAAAPARAQDAAAEAFTRAYAEQTKVLAEVSTAQVAEELRAVAESVASRGAKVNVTSTRPLLQRFERTLLGALQGGWCGASARPPARELASSAVHQAVAGSGLQANASDNGRLAALSARLLEPGARPALCRSTTLADLVS